MRIPKNIPADPRDAYRRGYSDASAKHSRDRKAAGVKGGHGRAASMSPERRREIAAQGAAARWPKHKAEQALTTNPE